MDLYENCYYNFTRVSVSLVGLWPYDKSRIRLVRVFVVYFNMCLILALQGAKIILDEHKIDVLLNAVPHFVICTAGILMYTNNTLKRSKLCELLDFVKQEWREKDNTKEFEIMKKYAEDSKMYSIVGIGVYYVLLVILTLIALAPIFLDFVYPLNEVRPRKLPFLVDFFIDEEKYFFSLLLLSFTMAMILGVSVISNTNMYLIFFQHICGMFLVTGNMIDNAFNDKHSTEAETYAKLARSVKYHKRILQFEASLRTFYEHTYLLLATLGMLQLALTFLQLIQKLSFTMESILDSMMPISIFVGTTIIAYIYCYFGQKIIDHSTFLFNKAYNVPWYLLTRESQMLLWLIIARSMKPCYLSLGQPFYVSIQFFASLLQTSVSYAMMFHSIQ